MNITTCNGPGAPRGPSPLGGNHRCKQIFETVLTIEDQLIRQYLVESVVVAGFSGIVAFVLIQVAVQILTKFFELPPGTTETQGLPMMLLPACLSVGLIAGFYPAFYLSAFDPVRVYRRQELL